MKRTLITSALPYANGYIHLGHCAGAYLPADIYARYLRLSGKRVLYVCGSDEHGVAITIAADKEKIAPKDIIDKYHEANKTAFERLGMSFDIYSRTSNPLHHETAREFFEDFLEKDYLIEKEEEQFYDEEAGMFLPDRYVEGICPNCGYSGARGDQCDSCGAYYDQLDLKEPKSLISGKTPVVRKTTHWYMRFDLFQKFLEEYIESHSGDWKDNVLQQTRSWLRQGLSERAITRDLSWGVSLDGLNNIPVEKSKGKVIYVWFDAVLGYISATKELMLELSNQGKAMPDGWKTWWQDSETRYIAFIGKDNIVFHTLIFPAMLHARNVNYILPDNVPANEFLNLEGQKFSKSRNWSIDLRDFIDDFPELDNIDALRYTLAMNFPETKDSDFTWKDFQSRKNNELSAVFGNYVNRTLQFIYKNFDGKVPVLSGKYSEFMQVWKDFVNSYKKDKNTLYSNALLKYNDKLLLETLVDGIVDFIPKNYDKFRFRDAISETMNLARAANKYFNDEEPWKTIKSDIEASAKSLYVCAQLVRSLAIIFAPVIPHISRKIFEMLSIDDYTGDSLKGILLENNLWETALYPELQQGSEIKNPEILFSKMEDKSVEEQTSKLGASQQPPQELITIEDFMKIKLRTAIVIEAEKVKKSKKLLKLKVDLAGEIRQIIAGIAEHYDAEALIGKTIIVVANLQPAKLMGLESQGMLLAANMPDGKLSIITTEKFGMGAGGEVR